MYLLTKHTHKYHIHVIDNQLIRVEFNNHWLSIESAFKGPIFVCKNANLFQQGSTYSLPPVF